MPKAIEMVPMYYANRSGRGNPCGSVSIDTARDYVQSGLAMWSKGAKYLKLLKTEAEMHRAAQSITMGPKVTQGAAEGNEYHISLVEAWKGLRAA